MTSTLTKNSREAALLKAFRQMTNCEQVKMLKTALQIMATSKRKTTKE